MANPEHLAWLEEGPDRWNARRRSQNFQPDLQDANISRALGAEDREFIHSTQRANARGINLSFANLRDAKLINIDLTGANFVQADLSGASLVNSLFTKSLFVETALRDTKLHSANFNEAKFILSGLEGAQFIGADLRGAQLWRCSLGGAHLYNADLTRTDFLQSQPLKAHLFLPTEHKDVGSTSFDSRKIDGIEDLLIRCREFRKVHGDDIALYFRGESSSSWDLRPSVMRDNRDGQESLRPVEGEMLNDLMTRQPESFSQLESAFAQWVLAQHHGLRTRLLDITRNPLVALYYACNGHQDEDGRLHVFAVPKSLIKPFNSDTISVIANFAKLPRGEQNMLLGKTKEDAADDVFPSNGDDLLRWTDEESPRVKARLYSNIRRERPYFEERIDIRDFYRVLVVEPERMSERIRAQSGAFLMSAFHERFERHEVLGLNRQTPVYAHFPLKLPTAQKRTVLDDLRLFNVTRETLFPSVDEAAHAVTTQYLKGRRPTTLAQNDPDVGS